MEKKNAENQKNIDQQGTHSNSNQQNKRKASSSSTLSLSSFNTPPPSTAAKSSCIIDDISHDDSQRLQNQEEDNIKSVFNPNLDDGLTVPPSKLGESSSSTAASTQQSGGSSIKQNSVDPDTFPIGIVVQTPAASRPIAINLPERKRQFHTPLSARGDLLGGYFPLHESSQQSYETHPFNKHQSKVDYHSEMKSDSITSTPSIPDPSQRISPYHPRFIESPEDRPYSDMNNPIPQTPPLVSMPPLGKYHPANYQNKTPSMILRSPRSQAMPPPSRPTISQQERSKLDMKANKQLLLKKYQRDMIEQATKAARRAGAVIDDPAAPKLTPIGSPGPVTPMELEESNGGGYLLAGAKRGSGYRPGENRKEADMVERMIRGEEERRRREGQSSPLIDC